MIPFKPICSLNLNPLNIRNGNIFIQSWHRMTYTPTLFYRFTVFITEAQQEDAFVKIFINRN